jgi:hypothetical protein
VARHGAPGRQGHLPLAHEKGFRRVRGHKQLHVLKAKRDTINQRGGLANVRSVAEVNPQSEQLPRPKTAVGTSPALIADTVITIHCS